MKDNDVRQELHPFINTGVRALDYYFRVAMASQASLKYG
jgi:hypothetical protein